jgi:AcrR family transcriptional regulator
MAKKQRAETKDAATPDLLREAFALIEAEGWRAFSLTRLAQRTNRPLAEVYAELPSRSAVLDALAKRLDAAMLGIDADELKDMSPRERVFELVMRRFDALGPFKGGIRTMSREGGLDIDLLAHGCGNVGRAVSWLLDVADAGLGPLRRAAAGPALALLYARVFNVWLTDDTPDHAQTLAELDRRLQQIEGLARWTAWLDREPRSRDTPEPDAQAASA